MRGGIQKKGNNYYAVVYDGIDPGRKRRRWVPAGTRRADAERVLADLIRRRSWPARRWESRRRR